MRMRTLALIAAASGLALATSLSPVFSETIDGRRIRIIDGDTVDLPAVGAARPERLRLVGIDAPETAHPRCAAEAIVGQQASARLTEIIGSTAVTIERHGADRYGRTLGRLITQAGDVEAVLLAAGLAIRYEPGRAAWQARRDHWCGEAGR